MTYATLQNALNDFLNNPGAANSYQKYSFNDNELYYDGKLLAKRTKLGEVLLSSQVRIPEADNDDLLFSLFDSKSKFERISDFNSLTNPVAIANKIKAGEFESVKRYADLFDIPINVSDFEVITENYKRLKELMNETDKLSVVLGERREAITNSFRNFENERRERAQAAELAALNEQVKELVVRWDSGESISTFTHDQLRNIAKANKSERLRIVKRGGAQERLDVQSTTNQRTSLRSLKQAFNRVAPYYWGSKTSILETRTEAYLDYLGNHQIRVSKNLAHMGCQSVAKSELERFATSQGWPLDGTPVAL